jgi:hypothetical protein
VEKRASYIKIRAVLQLIMSAQYRDKTRSSTHRGYFNAPPSIFGKSAIKLDSQPGNYLDWEGKTYAVLERHHRYQLKRDRLQKIDIYGKSVWSLRDLLIL